MSNKRKYEAEVEDELPPEHPELWPDYTDKKTREIMEAHGIMGPRAMFENMDRAVDIFRSHGFEWKAPE